MKKENNCLSNNQSANAVLTISIIMLVLSSSVLGMSIYTKYSMPIKTSAAWGSSNFSTALKTSAGWGIASALAGMATEAVYI